MKTGLTCVLVLCFISYCYAYSECKETGKVVGVKINNKPISLSDNTPAGLKKGENATLEVTFIPSINTSLEKSKCYGIIGRFPVSFPVAENGCQFITPGCPLITNQKYIFKTNIFVKEIYPDIKLIIKWEEQDQTGKDTFCLLIPAKIGA